MFELFGLQQLCFLQGLVFAQHGAIIRSAMAAFEPSGIAFEPTAAAFEAAWAVFEAAGVNAVLKCMHEVGFRILRQCIKAIQAT